jgi:hypothetical protein
MYRFSPINNPKDFDKAQEYIIDSMLALSTKIFNTQLKVTSVKVFAHYLKEYEYLNTLLLQQGKKSRFSSDTSLYIDTNKSICGQNITLLGIRTVDPYRLHVGCGDFEVENFAQFKRDWLEKTDYVKSFSDDMLEVWHPKFDILGYVLQSSS